MATNFVTVSMNVNSSTTTTTTGYYISYLPPEIVTTIVLPIIYYTVFVVGVVGNTLVIYILQKMFNLQFSLKRISDLFLVNLAIADLLFLCTLPFWATEYLLNGRWIFGEVICKGASYFTLSSAYGGVFFLSVLSLDRFATIVFHQQFKKYRTRNNAYITIAIIWLISLIISCPSLFFRVISSTKNNTDDVACHWNFQDEVPSHGIWFVIQFTLRFVVGFGLPLCIMVFSYLIVTIHLKRRRSQKYQLRKTQDRVTFIVWSVIFIFIICWLPNQISSMIFMIQGLSKQSKPSLTHVSVHLFTNCLTWSHSCFNPFLYAFMRKDFKIKFMEIVENLTTFRNVCKCKCRWNSPSRTQHALVKYNNVEINCSPHSCHTTRFIIKSNLRTTADSNKTPLNSRVKGKFSGTVV